MLYFPTDTEITHQTHSFRHMAHTSFITRQWHRSVVVNGLDVQTTLIANIDTICPAHLASTTK